MDRGSQSAKVATSNKKNRPGPPVKPDYDCLRRKQTAMHPRAPAEKLSKALRYSSPNVP